MNLHNSLPYLIQEWKKSGQINEEEQDTLLRLSAILDQQPRTEQHRDEIEALGARLRLLEAEKSDDPTAKATLVASEAASNAAEKKAKEAELSLLAVHIAGHAAGCKVRGETPAEAEEYFEDMFLGVQSAARPGPITPSEIRATIDEIKQAGLWPWKGSGIE